MNDRDDDNPFVWDYEPEGKEQDAVSDTPIMDEAIEDLIEAQIANPDEQDDAPDWDIVEHPTVALVLHNVAAKVASQYSGVTSHEDQYQEGAVRLAMNADMIRGHLRDELLGERAIYRWLHHRLMDGLKTDTARSGRHVPHHLYVEQAIEAGE